MDKALLEGYVWRWIGTNEYLGWTDHREPLGKAAVFGTKGEAMKWPKSSSCPYSAKKQHLEVVAVLIQVEVV